MQTAETHRSNLARAEGDLAAADKAHVTAIAAHEALRSSGPVPRGALNASRDATARAEHAAELARRRLDAVRPAAELAAKHSKALGKVDAAEAAAVDASAKVTAALVAAVEAARPLLGVASKAATAYREAFGELPGDVRAGLGLTLRALDWQHLEAGAPAALLLRRLVALLEGQAIAASYADPASNMATCPNARPVGKGLFGKGVPIETVEWEPLKYGHDAVNGLHNPGG
ncbi:MAG: hypothetical protein ACLPJH_11205 [Myxococcaceae bacterium]